MATLTAAAFAWLRTHHGIITIAQLERCGVSRATREQLLRAGVLIPVYRGVYRIASQPVTLETRCVALSARQPKGFVTGPSGGRMLGLRRMPAAKFTTVPGQNNERLEMVSYAVPHRHPFDLPGVAIRQTCLIEPTDVQVRSDGIRLASPWRLAFDLAADLSQEDLESVIEQILAKQFCRPVTLAQTAKRLAHPARPGSHAFVRALAERVPGGPLESHPEVQVAKALVARGLPIVAQATWLDLPNGRRVRLDVSVPPIRWGVEIDVHPDHFLQQGAADRTRDRQCHRIGWQIDRVTAVDLIDFDAIIDELVDNYHARVAEIEGRAR